MAMGDKPQPQGKPKRKWLRRIFIGLAVLVGAFTAVTVIVVVYVFFIATPYIAEPHQWVSFPRFGPNKNTIVFNFCPPPELPEPCRVASYNYVTQETLRFEGAHAGFWSRPSYSWDGRMIVMEQGGDADSTRLALFDVRSKTYRITGSSPRRKRGPEFSPDGQYIYYHGSKTDEEMGIAPDPADSKKEAERKNRLQGRIEFDIFSMNIEEEREKKIQDRGVRYIEPLAVNPYGFYHGVFLRRGVFDTNETIALTPLSRNAKIAAPESGSGFDRRDFTLNPTASKMLKKSEDGTLVYYINDDPFFKKRKSLGNTYIPDVDIEGAANDGGVLVSLTAAGDGYESDCADASHFGYNLFIVHPEKKTRRVTRFECAYFGQGLDISPDGERVLVHIAPRLPASQRYRAFMLWGTSQEEIQKMAEKETKFYVINSDGTGLQRIEFPKDFNAYKPVYFRKAE